MFNLKIIIIYFITLMFSFSFAGDFIDDPTNGTNLPLSVYINAISEIPEYDPDFDYTLLKSTKISLEKNSFLKNPNDTNINTKVVVNKSLYRLYVYKNNNLFRTYFIALGQNPKGHKQFEGDKKTPEGTYVLDYVKLHSKFYKAFHITYPNAKDISYAKLNGKKPGGMIMIHGQPNDIYLKDDYVPGIQSSNWTDGCIALLNEDMDDLLSIVEPGSIIEIMP